MLRVDAYGGVWGEYPVNSPCEGLRGSVLVFFFTSALRCHVTLHKLTVFPFSDAKFHSVWVNNSCCGLFIRLHSDRWFDVALRNFS